MPVWNHRLRNAPFHHIKEGSLKTEPTCLDVSISFRSISQSISLALWKSACLYLHTLRCGKELAGRQSVFMDSDRPRWSELLSCGIVVQFKHECKLDTKTKSIREGLQRVIRITKRLHESPNKHTYTISYSGVTTRKEAEESVVILLIGDDNQKGS